jgi:hypothetical protein
VWDEAGWTAEDAQAMLRRHERTPYRSAIEKHEDPS